MFTLQGPKHEVQSLAFRADNSMLYAAHGYVGVHVWNLGTRAGAPLVAKRHPVFGEFALAPNDRWALGRIPGACDDANDGYTINLRTGTARPTNFFGVAGMGVAFARSGTKLVTIGHSDFDKPRRGRGRCTRLYGWTCGATGPKYAWHRNEPDTEEPRRVAFAGESALVTEDRFATGSEQFGILPTKPRLALRDPATGRIRETADVPARIPDQLLASPDGSQVLVREGMKLWVWRTAALADGPRVIDGPDLKNVEPRAATFDRTGRFLLLANNGPSVRVLDTATWKEVRKWKWSAGTLRAVAVSPDGTLAAAGSARGTVVVWDLEL